MTRARAIELLKENLFCCNFEECNNAWDCDECVEAFNMAIEALEQEPKTGHWIGIDDYPHEDWECNNCGYVIEAFENPNDFRYCPNCGSYNGGDAE